MNDKHPGRNAPWTLIHVSYVQKKHVSGHVPVIEGQSKAWGWGFCNDWYKDGTKSVEKQWAEEYDGVRVMHDNAYEKQAGFCYDSRHRIWLPLPLTHPNLGKHFGALRLKIAEPGFIPGHVQNRTIITSRFEGFLKEIDAKWDKVF